MLGKAFLDPGNVAQGGQGTVPSLLNIPPDEQRVIGNHAIHANVDQVLDQVQPVGRPGLDLQAVSMGGVDHGFVGECDESGEGRVVHG